MIAPNSALCSVLSPPTAAEPNKPVVVAVSQVITVINDVQPPVAQTEVVIKKDPAPTAAPTEGPAATSAPEDKTAKEETKETKSADKGTTKNEQPVKKLYCN